ncbi:winged helix DNA-binding domain-containing protein [Paeniglutamicibacter sp. ZC-3]|uniref:winged helix DNA-binding domain-containing protein n=1 Tax=Paeniglutamicibacter sp. ZC-3 TaxID=2986919 RepID=UPI0021F75036|nr:winged helix DNA-binding domain-containing protein [Paeniglutamicibacter sp. ZC-3]MCV9995895.1 winged helix DNA-binding domain-containing protein [Paeniglutamicibacter sp. ZC-3]
MTTKSETPQIPQEKLTPQVLRAWSWHRQGLDGALAGCDSATVLDRVGWARSIGGANTYLTLFARAGIRRPEADAALAAQDIHELPTARGCTYVLPAKDYAWGLQMGHASAEAAVKVLVRLGVEREEIEQLAEDVLRVLLRARGTAEEVLDPRGLKEILGDKVRSMGEEGKKKGASTTLPAALGLLQADGRIRRVPVNGRLDQQRYSYVAWELPASGESDEAARARMLERFLGWTGGATLGQIRWFTAFTVAQAKKALAATGAVEVSTAAGEMLWMLPEDVHGLAGFEVPQAEDIQLLSGSDSLVLLRRNAADLFDEVGTESVQGMSGSALAADLSDHPIVDRGRIIGLWQYAPEETRIAWWTFEPASAGVRSRISQVEAWITEDLGDFRSFSLDSPKSRAKNIARLDQLRGA